MRRSHLLRSIVLLAAAACTGPTGGLDGSWRTLPVPSGGGIELSLTTAGREVTGTGEEYGLMGRHLASIVITGQQLIGTFSLTVRRDSGSVATYIGNIEGANELDGTWTIAGQPPNPLRFIRQ